MNADKRIRDQRRAHRLVLRAESLELSARFLSFSGDSQEVQRAREVYAQAIAKAGELRDQAAELLKQA